MKVTETVRARTSPAVSESVKRKADSIACTYGAELFTLGWIAGMLSAFFGFGIPAAVCAVLFCIVLLFPKKRFFSLYLRIFTGILLGIAVWMRYDIAVKQPLLALDGSRQMLTGTVTDAEPLSGGRARYTLRTELAGSRVSMDWYADADIPVQRIGDAVTLDAELTRIRPDYRYHTAAYQAGRGRYLRIYNAELLDAVPDTGFSLRRTAADYRQRMTDSIRAALSPEDAGLFCAMLFGDKTLLSDEVRLGMNRSGTGHLAVVSGLHLVLFCAVLRRLLKKSGCPAKLLFLLQIPAILLFILLVDASVSVWRAAVMVLLADSAVLFGRHRDTLRALCLAAILCTAFTPYTIGSVSFWLSFSAVLGIGVIAPYLTRNMSPGIGRDLLQFVCLSVTAFPASVLLCGESSLTAPVCNLVILPLGTAVLWLGFLFLLTGGTLRFLLPAAGMLCRFIRFVTQKAGALPFSHITVTAPAMRLMILLCAAALAIMLLCRAKPKTIAAAVAFAAILLSLQNLLLTALNRSTLQAAVLGGTKNTALVISAENRTVVADLTDTPRNAQYAARYLRDAGITNVDVMLLMSSRSAAAYQAELTDVSCGAVLLRDGGNLRGDTAVFGTDAFTDADGTVTLRCGDAEIKADENGLCILWNGMRIQAAEVLPEDGTAACIQYGKNGCAVRLSTDPPQYITENNLLLRLTKTGGGSLTRLMKTPQI